MTQENTPRLSIHSVLPSIDRTKHNALHDATLYDRADVVLDLLNEGFDVNRLSDSGWTPLHVASAYGRPMIAEILLAHGAETEIKQDSSTAIHMASVKGHADVVKLLLENKADAGVKRSDGRTPLHLAATKGQRDVVKLLASAGIDLEERADDWSSTALHMACYEGHSQCAAILLSAGADVEARDGRGFTCLMIAAAADHDHVATILIDSSADVDAVSQGGRTASNIAAYFGSAGVLQLLIKAGANLEIMDHDGTNALHMAITGQKPPKAALLLLEQRIRVNIAYGEHQDSALHLAVSCNQKEVVEALLTKGADVDACDADGDPPLQWAVEGDRMDMVRLLLRNGAQINKRFDKTGETALHWAVKYGLESMTQALLAHGSDPSLVDLETIQKRGDRPHKPEIDDEDFETCKILVETASFDEREIRPAAEFRWPLDEPAESAVEKISNEVASPPDAQKARPITNPVYEMTDQAAAESSISRFQDQILHKGVKCTGPHCAQKSGDLQGTRYKCTVCDSVDLCSTCISSWFNNHSHTHPVVRCRLPTRCQMVREVDEDTKRACALSKPGENVRPQDISHVVIAVTDSLALSRLPNDLNTDITVDSPQFAELLTEPTNFVFAISKERSTEETKIQRRGIIQPSEPKDGGLFMYKIDDAMNVWLEQFAVGQESEVKDEDKIIHHQDPALITDVMFGKIQRFNYSQNESFLTWAKEGRLVTRVIDLKPGQFDDKMELELRVVDLMQNPQYEALSYTWKETAYERALMKTMGAEESKTLKSIARHGHGVYCHNKTGEEAFLEVNTGLRDALKRLRDPSQTKSFWIDQLSVDQQNKSERTFQVARMMYIYNRAQRVVIWTGDEDQHTQVVFELYRLMSHVHRNLKPFPSPEEFEILTASLIKLDESVWQAAFSFFRRPVFGRSWCIQEMVVGQKAVIRCGEYEINWADMHFATRVMASTSWRSKWTSQVNFEEAKAAMGPVKSYEVHVETVMNNHLGSLTELITIADLREDFQTSKEAPLEHLLYATARFQATEARDKIYSVLGIRGANFKSGQQGDIKPDYEKSDAEVFTTATKYCIEQSSSLHICGMTDTVSNKKIDGLPTWVPDYSANAFSSTLAFSRPKPRIPYKACGDTPLIATWPYDQQQNILVTSSCSVGIIKTVSENSLTNLGQSSNVIEEWTRLAATAPSYPTGHFLPDIFLVTMFADSAGEMRHRPPPNPASFTNAIAQWVSKYFMAFLHEKCPEWSGDNFSVHCNRVAATIMQDAFENSPAAWGLTDAEKKDAPGNQGSSTNSVEVTTMVKELSISQDDQASDEPTGAASDSPEILSSATTNGDTIVEARNQPTESTMHQNLSNPLTIPKEDQSSKVQAPILHEVSAVESFALESLVLACLNRKFFLNTDRYFGIGPRDMQSGDEVHVLSGTKVPFIMRKITPANATANKVDQEIIRTVTEDGLDLYIMIGECFMYGVMQGEVMGREELSWDGIAIC